MKYFKSLFWLALPLLLMSCSSVNQRNIDDEAVNIINELQSDDEGKKDNDKKEIIKEDEVEELRIEFSEEIQDLKSEDFAIVEEAANVEVEEIYISEEYEIKDQYPKVRISTDKGYLSYDMDVVLKEADKIQFPFYGDNITVALSYNEVVKDNFVHEFIEMNAGYKDIRSFDNRLLININDTGLHSIKIPLEGKILDGTKELLIEVIPGTTADFLVMGLDKQWHYPDGTDTPDVINAELLLTDEPKIIEIKFSNFVNQESVEAIIVDKLKGSQYDMIWVNNHALRINIESFIAEDYLYALDFHMSEDTNGFPIGNGLYFSTKPAVRIMSYDIDTGSSQSEVTLHDIQYAIMRQNSVGNYILLTDKVHNYVYSLDDDQLETLDQLNLPYCLSLAPWGDGVMVDNENVIYFDHATETLSNYNLHTKEESNIVKIEHDVKNIGLTDISLSPNKDKISCVIDGYIVVYDLSGNLIYRNEEPIQFIQAAAFGGFDVIDVQWFSNEEIIYDQATGDQFSTDVKVDLMKTNILTNETEVFEKDAFALKMDSRYSIKLLQKYDDYYSWGIPHDYYIIKGEDRCTIDGRYLSSPLFIDDHRMVFSDFDELFLYDLTNNEVTKIGDGNVIGLSTDGKRIYYANDYYILPIT